MDRVPLQPEFASNGSRPDPHSAAAEGKTGADVCIVWVAPGQSVPANLAESLCRRKVTVIETSDAFGVIARACRAVRPASPEPNPGKVLIVFCDPARLDAPGQVLQTLGRYAPRAACWVYESAGGPRLRVVTPSDIQAWTAREAEPPVAASSGLHQIEQKPVRQSPSAPITLRLAGQFEAHETGQDEDLSNIHIGMIGGARDSSPAALTADELAMLLAGQDDDEAPAHRRQERTE